MPNSNWLLPEYIQDILPDEAWRIERMRANVLELLRLSGYQLVAPPLLEYAESLQIIGNHDMDLRTFKLVDQLSGRTLALRADIRRKISSPSRPASHALMSEVTSLRLMSRTTAVRRALFLSIGSRSKCGGTTGRWAKLHLPRLTSYSSGALISTRWQTAEVTT